MKDSVMIKSYPNGITLVTNPDSTIEEIIDSVKSKFKEAEKFFSNSRMSLTFAGKVLSDEEKARIIEVINDSASVDIVCVVEHDELHSKVLEELTRSKLKEQAMSNAVFHRGNIRSGQEIECDCGLIVIGDIHTGAFVSAAGNVIVLGTLKGTVQAGRDGNEDAFVIALSMDPVQIQIGDILARNTDRNNIESIQKSKYDPQIATVLDNRILIQPLSNN